MKSKIPYFFNSIDLGYHLASVGMAFHPELNSSMAAGTVAAGMMAVGTVAADTEAAGFTSTAGSVIAEPVALDLHIGLFFYIFSF